MVARQPAEGLPVETADIRAAVDILVADFRAAVIPAEEAPVEVAAEIPEAATLAEVEVLVEAEEIPEVEAVADIQAAEEEAELVVGVPVEVAGAAATD